jgi:3-oxoacyl-(acyl-carrier-protein) synthase
MITIVGHNIYTGVGFGSRAVYERLLEGKTGLSLREGVFGVPDPFYSSLFDRDEIDGRYARAGFCADCSILEKAMILSAEDAVRMAGIDASDSRTLFVISSTKGNVEMLETCPDGRCDDMALWHTASVVASHFGNKVKPVCVTNACTSGIVAQIAAQRAIENGSFDNAVVIGADMLSKFVVSGFQCLKALSPERCIPFDKSRCGLNLSEAVATIVFSKSGKGIGVGLERGCIRNDANHISAPSRTGEGQLAALESILEGICSDDVAFVNVHGTATIYNDNMESVALHRAGLDKVPAVSLKSFFGHTLGAAGVVETIISSFAFLDGVALPTYGYKENGVDWPLNISPKARLSSGSHFIKIMSGFGGINAATLYGRSTDA